MSVFMRNLREKLPKKSGLIKKGFNLLRMWLKNRRKNK